MLMVGALRERLEELGAPTARISQTLNLIITGLSFL
jgi:hypothetical protein